MHAVQTKDIVDLAIFKKLLQDYYIEIYELMALALNMLLEEELEDLLVYIFSLHHEGGKHG